MFPPSVPAATYRLQFNRTFTFDDATNIVEYLDRLGISHGYASSYFKAVPGSMHGYDVADPTQLNPEIGDRGTYNRWIETLRQHAMGHIADLVPNHMGIAKSANPSPLVSPWIMVKPSRVTKRSSPAIPENLLVPMYAKLSLPAVAAIASSAERSIRSPPNWLKSLTMSE